MGDIEFTFTIYVDCEALSKRADHANAGCEAAGSAPGSVI